MSICQGGIFWGGIFRSLLKPTIPLSPNLSLLDAGTLKGVICIAHTGWRSFSFYFVVTKLGTLCKKDNDFRLNQSEWAIVGLGLGSFHYYLDSVEV